MAHVEVADEAWGTNAQPASGVQWSRQVRRAVKPPACYASALDRIAQTTSKATIMHEDSAGERGGAVTPKHRQPKARPERAGSCACASRLGGASA